MRNRYQQTALHYAANRDEEDSASLLLQANCNPDAIDLNGDTALHLAAGKGNQNTITRLLQSPNLRLDIQNGLSKRPLEVARDSGFVTVVEMLEQQMGKAGICVEINKIDDITLRNPDKLEGNSHGVAMQHRTVVLNGVLPHLPLQKDAGDTTVSVSRLI